MTQYFQFKSATVPLVEYAGDDYTYQITNTGWTIIDVDAIDFAQLLDIINKVNTRELFVISRTKLFDALELKLGNELSANLAPSINGIISEWNGVSYDTEEDLRIRSIKLIDSKVTDIVQYNSIDKEVTLDFTDVGATEVLSEDVSIGTFSKLNLKGTGVATSIDPSDITGKTALIEVLDQSIEFLDEGASIGSYKKINVVGSSATIYEDPLDSTQAVLEVQGGINLVEDKWMGEGWANEHDGPIQNIHVIDSQYADIAQYDNVNGLTLNFSGVNNKAGFVCITNITPTNIADNVGSYEYDNSGIAMTSCRSSTINVDIEVLAITGLQDLKPTIIVNGSEVTLTPHTTENLWVGTISRTLVESAVPGEYIVEAYHSEGNTDTAIVYLETPPAVTVAEYTGTYPVVGQTSYVSGRTVGFTVTADKEFTHLEVLADSDCGLAYTAINPPELVAPFTEYTTRTGSALTIAVATNAVYTKHLKVRVKNANTTNAWGNAFITTGTTDHVSSIKLDSRLPVAAIGVIGYPGTQQALKLVEATDPITVTYTNVEAITLSSPNGDVSLSGTLGGGTVTATRLNTGSGYNITTPNLSILARRLTNDTQATSTAVVFIADATPTITMSVPYARLRSSGASGQDYAVTLTSNQKLSVAPVVTGPGGTLSPTWTGSVNHTVWTGNINVHDSDTKGAYTFGLTSAVNLAGVSTTTITSGSSYTLGGFVQRSGFFAALNDEVAIQTHVSNLNNATKLVVTIGGINGTYAANIDNVNYTTGNHIFTITESGTPDVFNATGNVLRINEVNTVAANTTGLLPYTIEELV